MHLSGKPSAKIDIRSYSWLATVVSVTKTLVDDEVDRTVVYTSRVRPRCSAYCY